MNNAKAMCFLVKKEKLLLKYKGIWSKIKHVMKRKKVNSNPMFDEKYLKTKIKFKITK